MESLNYPKLWGKNPKEVVRNLKKFNSKYVLIYQKNKTEINNKWIQEKFKVIGTLDWSIFFYNELDKESIWDDNKYIPKWFLLKLENN